MAQKYTKVWVDAYGDVQGQRKDGTLKNLGTVYAEGWWRGLTRDQIKQITLHVRIWENIAHANDEGFFSLSVPDLNTATIFVLFGLTTESMDTFAKVVDSIGRVRDALQKAFPEMSVEAARYVYPEKHRAKQEKEVFSLSVRMHPASRKEAQMASAFYELIKNERLDEHVLTPGKEPS